MNYSIFDNRKLSLTQAETIANSQTDLGGVSKRHMITALADTDFIKRVDAYERLDSLSKLIVKIYLKNQSIQDSTDELKYVSRMINNAISI